ncbi:tryptophan synthase alpha chain [Tepidimonas ignava]|uniref:Tryptophan synthase alpha chain n=1 Tax=Tepidimonas ignava TaxID=114249 RepID=A0A4R3LGM7_9BURK|nr:tryptophan synthase subunit alpha [Tepidimonas ignava]TCS98615.1 tryptophan synthase alpha chain [Tepidimonas ignava]TSE20672.1 Tryptophan synthase alpha chain [Tepidimonas ignava]
MSRLAPTFERLRAQGRRALIPFVTAGFPDPTLTPAVLDALVAGGADVIELGVPFSDPMADGPVIQRAGERALAAGVDLARVLAMAHDFRARHADVPLVLMGYANPIEAWELRHGAGSFARAAAQAGVDGVLVVDYPPEECAEFAATLRAHGLDLIFLLAPTSTEARMAQVGALASGYVYYVSLKGVTGAAHLDTAAVEAMLPRIRAHVRVPVGVGFGIRDAASAQAVGRHADAVVIGTRLIQVLDEAPPQAAAGAAQALVRELRAALDALPPLGAAGA